MATLGFMCDESSVNASVSVFKMPPFHCQTSINDTRSHAFASRLPTNSNSCQMRDSRSCAIIVLAPKHTLNGSYELVECSNFG